MHHVYVKNNSMLSKVGIYRTHLWIKVMCRCHLYQSNWFFVVSYVYDAYWQLSTIHRNSRNNYINSFSVSCHVHYVWQIEFKKSMTLFLYWLINIDFRNHCLFIENSNVRFQWKNLLRLLNIGRKMFLKA